MDHQLVIQFRGDSADDLDAIIEIEDELTEHLGAAAEVDGHDIGSGEANVFIFTADPAAAFELAKPVLERRQQLQSVTAAYRDVDGDEFTVIWPKGSRKKFSVI